MEPKPIPVPSALFKRKKKKKKSVTNHKFVEHYPLIHLVSSKRTNILADFQNFKQQFDVRQLNFSIEAACSRGEYVAGLLHVFSPLKDACFSRSNGPRRGSLERRVVAFA